MPASRAASSMSSASIMSTSVGPPRRLRSSSSNCPAVIVCPLTRATTLPRSVGVQEVTAGIARTITRAARMVLKAERMRRGIIASERPFVADYCAVMETSLPSCS